MKREIIIVPTYNEKDTISGHLLTLVNLFPDMEILVVDDSSPDGTGTLVMDLSLRYPKVSLMTRKVKKGLGAAYKAALLSLVHQDDIGFIFTMDADGSHDPQYIVDMRRVLKEGSTDLVIGSRYVQKGGVSNWDLKRRLLSKGGNMYSSMLLHTPIKDLTSGFVGFSLEMLRKIDLSSIGSGGYAYQIEFKYRMFRAGARIAEVPIIFCERIAGRSKMNYKIIIEGLLIPLRIFLS